MSALERRREALTRRLAADPYSVGPLAELAVLDIMTGRGAEARIRDLRRMAPALQPVIARLAEEPERLAKSGSFYTIGRVEAEEAERLERAQEMLPDTGEPPPAILIELARQRNVPTFAHVPGPGFAYICLGTVDDGHSLPAMVHELAHAWFVSGVRYLDEGIARYFELTALGTDFERLASEVGSEKSPILRPRALLSYAAVDDPYFSRLGLSSPTIVHDHGALFARGILASHNGRGLASLCRNLRERDGRVPVAEVVEATLGMALEQLEPTLQAQAATAPPRERLADDAMRAMLRLDGPAISRLRAELDSVAPLDETQDPLALEAWVRVLIFQLLSNVLAGGAEEQDVAVAEAALERYAKSPRSEASLLILSALLEIAHVSMADNEMAGLARLASVRRRFEQARNLEPHNVEAQYQFARFTMLTPDEYADDKSKASRCLTTLTSHADYGEDVRAGLLAAGFPHLAGAPAGAVCA
jgi:hypothetical protein